MDVATLAQSDHLLYQRANCLCLGDGRFNAILDDNRGHQVTQQSAAMAGIASEFESCITMPHGFSLSKSKGSGNRDQGRITPLALIPVLLNLPAEGRGYYPLPCSLPFRSSPSSTLR